MSEYISIAEFAKRAGVSRQAVYSQLDKKLSSYCQVDNGKKTIHIKGLEVFSVKEDCQVDSRIDNQNCQVDNEIDKQLTAALTDTIAVLREQLAAKDRQLEAAAAENAELLQRLKDAQQSAQQAQALHAGTMQQALIEARTTAEDTEEAHKRGWKWWRR